MVEELYSSGSRVLEASKQMEIHCMSGSDADADPQLKFGATIAVQKVITNNSVTSCLPFQRREKKHQQSESKIPALKGQQNFIMIQLLYGLYVSLFLS